MTSAPVIDQFFVQVDGTDLGSDVLDELEEAVVEDDLLQPAMFTLRFYDRDLALIEGSTFKLGAQVVLGITNQKGVRKVILEGEVTALEPEFEAHYIALVVRGYDKSHRLYRGAKTRAFTKKADSDIASEIVGEAGLSASASATGIQYDLIMQENQTDMEFLRARAARIGYTVRYDGKKLLFGKAESSPPEAPEQTLGDTLLSFRVRLSAASQPNSVEVRGWDGKAKQAIVGTASSSAATSSIGFGKTASAAAQEAFSSSTTMVVTDQPVQTTTEATKLAQAILDDLAGNYLAAEGVCLGEPALKAGTKVKVKGVGTRFGGSYFVTATRHEYTAATGYRTTFVVNGRNPNSIVGSVAEQSRRHVTHGVAVGIVTNVNDPDNLGRVKLKFPWLDDQLESDWARLAQPGAGPGRGWFIPPEVDDEVLVAFDQGDINRPYVIGGLWNSQDAPPASAVADGKVKLRAIKTRAGHTIEIGEDDGGDKGYVTIKTGKDQTIQISDTDKKIEIKSSKHTVTLDDQGNAVTLTSGGTLELSSSHGSLTFTASGVELSSSNGKLSIAPAGVELSSSNGKLSIAPGNLELSGTAMMKVKGAMVNLQSDAMMEVKASALLKMQGALVMIN